MGSRRRSSGSNTTGCSRIARGAMAERRPIEIKPPDIARYRAGNTGVGYVRRLDSGGPGANVMVQALTHGNEFSGAIALDYLLKEGLRPTQGMLTFAFANVAAFGRFDAG